MKKSIVAAMIVVSIFTFGAAYAADSQAAGALSNGITYFDLGPASTCNELVGSVEADTAKPFNGVTAFDLGKTGARVQNSCADKAAQTIMSKNYNGITVF